ncbi:AEC family transporter [Flavobacterium crassostreae]|uniref:Transporter n=1 Tax=Flavobacterium crassostreae TaxID=1763534 RepID=A0A1B9E7T2_9FLAO|nr:AEC family transporter [Flavobacterium crassostreae]OCB78017.1 transporter [Flavobacterium crassostreae]
MITIVLIFFYLFLGLFLQKSSWFPTNTYKQLNKIVIYLCLPALSLFYIPKIHWNNQLLYPIAVAWIGFVGAFVLFWLLSKKYGWSKKLTGCLILTAGLGNTAFLGFPIIEALYGEEGLKTAILVDQPGSFVVLSTLGILVATVYSKEEKSSAQIIQKILVFPPFLTFVIACLMNIYGFDFQLWVQELFKLAGKGVTPLALVSVGLQLRFETKSQHWKFLALGLLYKLIITPAIIYFLYVLVWNQHSKTIEVAILEAAMAPMITATILASSHGLKPRLSSMMIGFGIPISFISLFIWYCILKWI